MWVERWLIMNKKIIYGFIFLIFYSNLSFGINLKLLDLSADTFNGRIWNKIENPIPLIQENLGFVNGEDDIKNYQHSESDFNTSVIETGFNLTIQDNLSHYKAFASNCLEIYQYYAEIDKTTQAAVSMLFKKVSQKFSEQQKFIEHHYHLQQSIDNPILETIYEESPETYNKVISAQVPTDEIEKTFRGIKKLFAGLSKQEIENILKAIESGK